MWKSSSARSRGIFLLTALWYQGEGKSPTVAPVWPLTGGPWRPLCVPASGFSSIRDHIRQPLLLSLDFGKQIDQHISVILKVELNTELFISNSIVESQPKRP